MPISLMPYIPDYFIIRSIEDIMKCNSQFHHTQTGSEMSRVIAYNIYNELPEFRTNLYKIFGIKLSEIFRSIYL